MASRRNFLKSGLLTLYVYEAAVELSKEK